MAVLHFFLLNSPLIYILFSLDFVLKVDTVECDPTVQGLLMKKKPSTLMVGMLAIEIKICSFTNEKVIHYFDYFGTLTNSLTANYPTICIQKCYC